MNKPGGTARILSVNSDGSYDVRYILSSTKDYKIPSIYVTSADDLLLERKERIRKTNTDEIDHENAMSNSLMTPLTSTYTGGKLEESRRERGSKKRVRPPTMLPTSKGM